MVLPLLALLDDPGPAMLGVDCLEHSAFDLQACSLFGELWSAARRTPGSVALVDWRRIGCLLNDEHEYSLENIHHVVPLVLLLDDTFGQQRHSADLGITAVLDSPIQRADLLAVMTRLSRKALGNAGGVL